MLTCSTEYWQWGQCPDPVTPVVPHGAGAPRGLSEIEHVAWAKCQKHVLSHCLSRPISKQVKEAVEFEAYTDLEEIDAMRQAFMDELMLRVMKMKGETAVWRAAVHSRLRPVIGMLNGPLIREIFYATDFGKFDETFLDHCFEGFPGQLPATHYDTAEAKHMAPCITRQQLVDLRMDSNERIVSTLWSSEHDEEMMAKTEEEAAKGWLGTPVPFTREHMERYNRPGAWQWSSSASMR